MIFPEIKFSGNSKYGSMGDTSSERSKIVIFFSEYSRYTEYCLKKGAPRM
jgi:hypothetical protein